MENTIQDENFLVAVMRGDIDAAIEAIKAGASINAKTSKGNNALYLAASREQEDMFDFLLQVEKDGQKIDLNNRNQDGATCVYEFIRLPNMFSYLKKVLVAGADASIPLYDGTSPLIHACAFKYEEAVDLLLDKTIVNNIDLDYEVPHLRTTALMTAAATEGSLNITKKLVEAGADITKLDNSNRDVLVATMFKSPALLKKKEKAELSDLCDYLAGLNFNLNNKANSGLTAFWAAALNQRINAMDIMLDKGVNPDVWHEIALAVPRTSALHLLMNFRADKKAKDPIAEIMKLESIKNIIRKSVAAGADLNAKDELGNTAAATGFLNPDLRDLMLELNADVNSAYHIKDTRDKKSKDKVIKIPTICSIINEGDKQKEFVQEIINRGAKVEFDATDNVHHHPLAIAIRANAVECFKMLIDTNTIDLNRPFQTSDKDITPLMLLVSEEKNNLLESYLAQKEMLEKIKVAQSQNEQKGIESQIVNKEGMKAVNSKLDEINKIEGAINEQRVQMFNYLVDNSVDVNYVNTNGKNALFFAKSAQYAQLLIDKGIDVDLEDKLGNNVFMNAVMTGKYDMVDFMAEYSRNNGKKFHETIYYDLAFVDYDNSINQSQVEKSLMRYLREFTKEADENKNNKDYKVNIPYVNFQDADGNTPLLVACANDVPFLVALYKRLGGDVNLPNNNGETPIMHAISNNNPRVVAFLMESGADMQAKTKDGKSVDDFLKELNDKDMNSKIESTIKSMEDRKKAAEKIETEKVSPKI